MTPIPKEVLDILTPKSRACIENFADHLATLAPVDSSVIHLFYWFASGNQVEMLMSVAPSNLNRSSELF